MDKGQNPGATPEHQRRLTEDLSAMLTASAEGLVALNVPPVAIAHALLSAALAVLLRAEGKDATRAFLRGALVSFQDAPPAKH